MSTTSPEQIPGWPYRTEDILPLLEWKGSAINTPAQWDRKRKDIRRRVTEILGSSKARRVPLRPEILEERKLGGYVRRKIRYWVEEDEAVSAYLLVPSDGRPGPFPAVLCLHQTTAAGKREVVGFSGSSTLQSAAHLAERGYVTLAPDSLAAGERVPTRQGVRAFDTAEFYEKHPDWSAVGKMLWDNRCALDYLCGLDFVDARRIGCIGHSLGGHGTFFTMAFDERIRAGVSSCGFMTMAGDERPLRWARDHWYIYIKKLRPYLLRNELPFDMHEVISLIAPRPFLNLSGHGDECFPNAEAIRRACEEIAKVYGLLGAAERFGCHLHEDGHAFRAPVRKLAYEWLEKQLEC